MLTWNDTEMAAGCIESLLACDYPNLRIVLVDNGSREPCGEILKARFPGIEVVRLAENQGFTGGCNRGLERVLEGESAYAFLLNNDTIVAPTALSELVESMDTRPRCAAATPLILNPGEEKIVSFYRATIDRDCARHFQHDKDVSANSRTWPTVETEFAPACALLLRTAALRQIGLFDERLGTNWEDYDLCVRILDGGWSMLSVGGAQVVHAHGATTGRSSPYITYYSVRNRLICLFRYGRLIRILRKSPFIARSFYWQIEAYGFMNWACHWAFVKGCLHFVLGVRSEGRAPQNCSDRRRGLRGSPG